MENSEKQMQEKPYVAAAIDITLRVGLLILGVGACYVILKPFLLLIIWGVIIAVAFYPLFNWLKKILNNKGGLAATIITVVLLAIILVPSVILGESLAHGIQNLREANESGKLTIQPPGPEVDNWPRITKPVVNAWKLASESTEKAMQEYGPQIKKAAAWFISTVGNIATGLLQLIIATIIAGVLLVYARPGSNALNKLFIHLLGKQGEKIVEISEVTIRQVVKGILGVAIIQTLMAAIGFFVAGVPMAGLLSAICLILCIVQLGVAIVAIPVMIYMFANADTLTASLLTVWLLITMISDNILKPILLGRGAPVPMLVIFLGAIGGFIAMGFIGLFVGAVILSICYKIYQVWNSDGAADTKSAIESTAGKP
jgi:predicted PurR-regulated permease PerM